MKYITREKILILNKDDLINFTDDSDAGYSFTIYKNIYVVLGKDFDPRVLDLIDDMPYFIQENLVAIQGDGGRVSFLWRDDVPSEYAENSIFCILNGIDSWLIMKSITVCLLETGLVCS